MPSVGFDVIFKAGCHDRCHQEHIFFAFKGYYVSIFYNDFCENYKAYSICLNSHLEDLFSTWIMIRCLYNIDLLYGYDSIFDINYQINLFASGITKKKKKRLTYVSLLTLYITLLRSLFHVLVLFNVLKMCMCMCV